MEIDLNCLYLGPDLKNIKTDNYFFKQKDSSIKEFINAYLNMSPQEVIELQNSLSETHAKYEMNFQVRDKSGLYSKVVATPFHGFAPLPKTYIESLVKSTQPVLKLTRTLLQNVYSASELTLESLGLDDMDSQDKKELFSIVKNNIYYEPMYHHKVFKDYPFLSIVGFDSAVQNLKEPDYTFFELNAGTPCGIEDQEQLYKRFEKISPHLFKLIDPFISMDKSHEMLKQTVDSCAKFWTGQDGISVVLSPGPYNPAHPEIANLALKSGMPLVKMSDLYIDNEGCLRLITNGDHPKITGIYNRKEESFLTYSQELKIPLRSPFTSMNQELSNQFGLDLKDGILYSYQYDQNSKIIGVDLNEDGSPKYQTLFDAISPDPSSGKLGSIMEAVWKKNLFISNLGGRVFDDKRAFRIISDYLLKMGEKNYAHPPHSIKASDLDKHLESAVVKAPDLSGGAGVTILAQISEQEQNEVLKNVLEKPSYYEIQQMTKLAVVHSYHQNDNKIQLRPLPVDWRLIIFFNEKDQVQSSTHSCLVRTAPFGSLKTNTSSGGGYALALIYDDKIHSKNENRSPIIQTKYVGLSRTRQLQAFIENLKNCHSTHQIEGLIYELRDLIDLIDSEQIPFLQQMRAFQQGSIDQSTFEKQKKDFLREIDISRFQ